MSAAPVRCCQVLSLADSSRYSNQRSPLQAQLQIYHCCRARRGHDPPIKRFALIFVPQRGELQPPRSLTPIFPDIFLTLPLDPGSSTLTPRPVRLLISKQSQATNNVRHSNQAGQMRREINVTYKYALYVPVSKRPKRVQNMTPETVCLSKLLARLTAYFRVVQAFDLCNRSHAQKHPFGLDLFISNALNTRCCTAVRRTRAKNGIHTH
jgi:hypothetical protein